MSNQSIISQYEEIDRVHKDFSKSLKDFSRELEAELGTIDKIMTSLKNNWHGTLRDNFVNNFDKKTAKLEECDGRVLELTRQLDELSKKLQEGLEFLRTH